MFLICKYVPKNSIYHLCIEEESVVSLFQLISIKADVRFVITRHFQLWPVYQFVYLVLLQYICECLFQSALPIPFLFFFKLHSSSFFRKLQWIGNSLVLWTKSCHAQLVYHQPGFLKPAAMTFREYTC